MADTLWILFELLITVFESFVCIYFVCAFLKHDFSTSRGKIIFIGGSVIFSALVIAINNLTIYEGILGIIYSFFYFVFALLLLNGTVLKKIFVSILTNVVSLFIASSTVSIISVAFQDNINVIYTDKSISRIVMVIIVQALRIYVYGIILKLTGSKEFALKKKEWALIISVFLISLVSLGILHMTQVEHHLSVSVTQLMLLSELGIIIINVVCFYMTIALSRSNQETLNLKHLKQQHELMTQYAANVRQQYEEIRSIRHNIKQDFSVINALLKEQKFNEASEFAEKCGDSLSKLDVIMDVGNTFVNAILNSKISLAKEKGINIICSSSKDVSGVEDTDLCVLLGNMLDNAIEAAEKSAGKSIEASISADDSKLLIKVMNTVDRSVLQSNPELKTDKEDKKLHGYGVETIKSIAKKYNGHYDFYEENKYFCCNIVLFK